ncbi:hypothetical protein JZ751_007167 [Albula glossodonta]|uniref:DUF4585 domain-containing protein n=1 Tax=Albula glossodonta TaxID=121402 RepID=A0A8T2P6B8_9TELE|nr:hypothetical protein JZ751_007167 [Albula glossodonta]
MLQAESDQHLLLTVTPHHSISRSPTGPLPTGAGGVGGGRYVSVKGIEEGRRELPDCELPESVSQFGLHWTLTIRAAAGLAQISRDKPGGRTLCTRVMQDPASQTRARTEVMEVVSEDGEGGGVPFLHAGVRLRYSDAPDTAVEFHTDSQSQDITMALEWMAMRAPFGGDSDLDLDPPIFCSSSTCGPLAQTGVGDPLLVDDAASESSGSYHTALCSDQLSDNSETFQDSMLNPSPEPTDDALSLHPRKIIPCSRAGGKTGCELPMAADLSPKLKDRAISHEHRETDLSPEPNTTDKSSKPLSIAPPSEISGPEMSSTPKATAIPPEPLTCRLMEHPHCTLNSAILPEHNHPDPLLDPAPKRVGIGLVLRTCDRDWRKTSSGLTDHCSPLQPSFTSQLILTAPKRAPWAKDNSLRQLGKVSETPRESPCEHPVDWRAVSRLRDRWPSRARGGGLLEGEGEGAGQRSRGEASGRREQTELSLRDRNRKAGASSSPGLTATETQSGMSACCYSERLPATQQQQQEGQQNCHRRGQGSQQGIQQGPTKPRAAAQESNDNGENTSMESELDEADSEVKQLTDLAFKSLSAPPPVDYLDVRDSSCRSSADASQGSVENDPVAAAWSAYAELHGSASGGSDCDNLFQPWRLADGKNEDNEDDDGESFATGVFECVDVALESREEVQRGAGPKTVPKRQIQLRRCNTDDSQASESGEFAAQTSPPQHRKPKSIYLRQHSTPATVQEGSYKAGAISPAGSRKQRLQKSLSLDETSTKTKMASSLIKNVLSKKMQSELQIQQHQSQEGDISPSQPTPVRETQKTKVSHSYLCSNLPLGRRWSTESQPHQADSDSQGRSLQQHERLSAKTHLKPFRKHSFSAFQSATERPTDSHSNRAERLGLQPETWEKLITGEWGRQLAGGEPSEICPGDSAKVSAGSTTNTQAKTSGAKEDRQAIPRIHKQRSLFLPEPPKIALASCAKEEKKGNSTCLPPDLEIGVVAEAVRPRSDEIPAGKEIQGGRGEAKWEGETRNREDSERGLALAPLHRVRDMRKLVKSTYNLSFNSNDAVAPGHRHMFREQGDKPFVALRQGAVIGIKNNKFGPGWSGKKHPEKKMQASKCTSVIAPAEESCTLCVGPSCHGNVRILPLSHDKKPSAQPIEVNTHSLLEPAPRLPKVPHNTQKLQVKTTSAKKPAVTTGYNHQLTKLTQATECCLPKSAMLPTSNCKEQLQKPREQTVASTNKHQQVPVATVAAPACFQAVSFQAPNPGPVQVPAPQPIPCLPIQASCPALLVQPHSEETRQPLPDQLRDGHGAPHHSPPQPPELPEGEPERGRSRSPHRSPQEVQPPYPCSTQEPTSMLTTELAGKVAGTIKSDGLSFGQSSRRLLLDPETGTCFYMEVPVQPQRKVLFDPESGQYMEIFVPPSAMYPPSITPCPYPYLPSPGFYAPQYLPYSIVTFPQGP